MRLSAILLPAILLVGCSTPPATPVNEKLFEPGISLGQLADRAINEASGIAASTVNPGMLWTHNDSGDKARIFLIDSLGRTMMVVNLAGIKNRDWEDIAVGPGPDSTKTYVYIGEIGDNDARYELKYIYRIEEPVFRGSDTTIAQVDSIKFGYPDGNRDAETVLVDPLTRDLFIVSKREKRVNLYRLPFPQSTTAVITAELAAPELDFNRLGEEKGYHPRYFNQIVGGDISPDGSEILIKDYSSVYYWKRNRNETLADALKRTPEVLPYAPEARGEGIAFSMKGDGYYTLSEEVDGHIPHLVFYRRKK
ncbi:MAG: hypothetical protein L6Q51_06590 [Cyclobacteriaceae bacterium]|nr:hypothetical protein [Cyclobacteriaceae bacterium]